MIFCPWLHSQILGLIGGSIWDRRVLRKIGTCSSTPFFGTWIFGTMLVLWPEKLITPKKLFLFLWFSLAWLTCFHSWLSLGLFLWIKLNGKLGLWLRLQNWLLGNGWKSFLKSVLCYQQLIWLFEAQLSSSAFQLLGMADIGSLPKFFGLRSKWFNTP